jgi:hypothetical protein
MPKEILSLEAKPVESSSAPEPPAASTSADEVKEPENEEKEAPAVPTSPEDTIKFLQEIDAKISEWAAFMNARRGMLTTAQNLIKDAAQIQQVIKSGAEGKRMIPKDGESLSDFVNRAKKQAGSSWSLAIWKERHEGELRREFPNNFSGEGW